MCGTATHAFPTMQRPSETADTRSKSGKRFFRRPVSPRKPAAGRAARCLPTPTPTLPNRRLPAACPKYSPKPPQRA
ncbi:hypothetical protein [Kingella potus]|uniref:hypothetical protein n=1 Tax=Kingella potus TaxID=265175 RepID=UPI001FD0D31D|nr:hypothetical protein [Kingella potus]UOP00289.1 hypothetical protein LVJ84_10300 [Kingella potus]